MQFHSFHSDSVIMLHNNDHDEDHLDLDSVKPWSKGVTGDGDGDGDGEDHLVSDSLKSGSKGVSEL